jgi:hypothetical protein
VNNGRGEYNIIADFRLPIADLFQFGFTLGRGVYREEVSSQSPGLLQPWVRVEFS